MNAVSDTLANEFYSASNSRKPTNFYCSAPNAKSVSLVGDFNHGHSIPMRRRVDGWWFIQVELPHGHHQYHFLVDGQRTLDPQAAGTARDNDNQPVSLLAVS